MRTHLWQLFTTLTLTLALAPGAVRAEDDDEDDDRQESPKADVADDEERPKADVADDEERPKADVADDEEAPARPAPRPAAARSTAGAAELDLDTWKGASVEAFAVEDWDASGRALPAKWIEADDAVSAFGRAIAADEAEQGVSMPSSAGLTAWVALSDGKTYEVELIDVDADGGWVELDDALIPVGADLASAIARGAGGGAFSSSANKNRSRLGRPAASFTDIFHSYEGSSRKAHTLVLWEDAIRDNSSEAYAKNYAGRRDDVVTLGLTAPGPMFRALKSAAASADACFNNVIVIAHGAPAEIELSAKGRPAGAHDIGYKAGQMKPADFGKALKPFLCGSDPQILLMSCQTARYVGGRQLLKDLAKATGAVVTGSDSDVKEHADFAIEVAVEPKQGNLGNLLIAQPGGGEPRTEKQAPGNRWTLPWEATQVETEEE